MRKGNRIKAVATSADYRFYGYLCGGKLHSDPTAFALSTYVSHKNSGNDVAPMESFEPVTLEGKDYVFLAGLFTLDHTNGKETTYGLCVTQEDMLKLLKMEQIASMDLKTYADEYIDIIMIPLCRILNPKKEEYERQLVPCTDPVADIVFNLCLDAAKEEAANLPKLVKDKMPPEDKGKKKKEERKSSEIAPSTSSAESAEKRSAYNLRENRGQGIKDRLQDQQGQPRSNKALKGKVLLII
jgi:hypothetical protein